MENLLTEKLHQQYNEVKKDTHVPMTVDEVCEYLGISKSSFYYLSLIHIYLTIHDLIHCFWHCQSHGKDWWHNMQDVCTVRMRARKMSVFMTILRCV